MIISAQLLIEHLGFTNIMMSQSSDLRFDNFVHDSVRNKCVATHLKQKITTKISAHKFLENIKH